MSQEALDGYLLEVLKAGHWEKVFTLIAEGANARAQNDLPFRRAAAHNRIKEAAILISMGADPGAQLNFALLHACRMGYVDMVCLLAESCVNLNEPEGEPLRLAVENFNIEVVRFLIEHGADVPATGARALWQAVKNGSPALESLLIEAGATLEVVANEADEETLERLVRAGASTNNAPAAQAIAQRITLEQRIEPVSTVRKPVISRGVS